MRNTDAPGNKVKIHLWQNLKVLHFNPAPFPGSVKCEQPLDELTIQVWLLYHFLNHNYCTLFVSGTELQTLGSGDRFLVHTGIVHGGFAVLLKSSCYEFVILILYCINMLDMKYACCRVDMCCVGWGWIWGKWRHQCPYLGLTKSRVVFVQER